VIKKSLSGIHFNFRWANFKRVTNSECTEELSLDYNSFYVT